ncbi:hypothetical protein BCR37DRAFT_384192 [Protomyces lactucae-debilis]|uniref:Uncharacterized protein n=1 Tax=Protomyces lactucae-debilis TaxID=2754530 RepID=A0A1Y2EWC6_PROLT|nr:uncharacterized protein BCR37DRAFT_384192 [Protomyces lactucae-debilis]ORY75125.1 hypothetical protein BCR37DRAFT_384192 [Protomyces lactucae-debilis]
MIKLPFILTFFALLALCLILPFLCGNVNTSSLSTTIFLLRLDTRRDRSVPQLFGAVTPAILQLGIWGGCTGSNVTGNPGYLIGTVACGNTQQAATTLTQLMDTFQLGSLATLANPSAFGNDVLTRLSAGNTLLEALSILAALVAATLSSTSVLVACCFPPRSRLTHTKHYGRVFWTRVPFFLSLTLTILLFATVLIAHISMGSLQRVLAPAPVELGITAFVLLWVAFFASLFALGGWIYHRKRLLSCDLV